MPIPEKWSASCCRRLKSRKVGAQKGGTSRFSILPPKNPVFLFSEDATIFSSFFLALCFVVFLFLSESYVLICFFFRKFGGTFKLQLSNQTFALPFSNFQFEIELRPFTSQFHPRTPKLQLRTLIAEFDVPLPFHHRLPTSPITSFLSFPFSFVLSFWLVCSFLFFLFQNREGGANFSVRIRTSNIDS